ncbi:glycosyl transferase group 1 [Chthoniobacter flavus Ellin428]|uniref:Glycosyl transferase group 1 n=1 Tax=Chthoniobacter flavus Ellin428 TaxID=497964 RepID=B4CTT0_9BACT|nr:glycosyltransferase family 4 protein [Chthoniobacter flavus]EDY21968.1 glycosyl transferase group 1 [Chthoniobacter flavus Ellin428]TCO89356.1 glycosyltransferase involved in cell wall biosynthesis [Chthoniobacter flavus]
MQSVRVAVVSRWRPDRADGVDQAVAWTSRALVNLGCEVEIWEASPRHHRLGFREAESGIRVCELPVLAKGFVIPPVTREFVVRESQRLQVAHFHSCFVPANVRLAPLLRCPYVITPHGGYSRFRMWLRGAVRKWIFFWLFSRRYLERAAFVHVLSDLEKEAVMDLCAQRRFVVATSGCIGFPPAPAPWRETGVGRRLLFIGRLDVDCKGLDRAVQAFAAASEKDDHLTLAGPDFRGGRNELQGMVGQLQIADRVTIRDGAFGDEKQQLIAASDVFIQLSRWEGVPLTPIEAMGLGRPLLVTPETNLANYVTNADAGWVADEADCVAGMRASLRTPVSELLAKGAHARRLVETEFQWNTTAQRLLDGYRDIHQ